MIYDSILAEMQARYRQLAGFEADQASDIGIRLRVLAAETAALYEQMSALKQEVFPQTSSGQYLDMHAETKAITRKPAICAQANLRFSRETPAISNIVIPKGVLCATRQMPQLVFETTQAATLMQGSYSVDIPAIAQEPGAASNVATGAVCMMISPAAGISVVSNPAAFSGGVDAESDDALRERLLAAYQNISNGTNSAFYYDLAMSNEGVSSANVLARKRGRGTVDVVITCHVPAQQTAVIAQLQADLNKRKEINVDVLVRAAVQDNTAITAQIAAKEGYTYALVKDKVQAEITDMLQKSAVGKALLLAELGKRILQVDGVYNYKITVPANDISPASDHVLRPGTITLSAMAVG